MLQNVTRPVFYQDADGASGSPAAEPTKSDNSEPMIPKSRFDEVNQRAKDAEARLQQMDAERQTEVEKRLEEQQKWKELADERATKLAEAERKAAKVDEYETEMRSYVEESMNKIPEDMKSLVPDGAPEQQFRWLKKNLDKLVKPIAPPTGAGARGAGGDGKQFELAPEESLMAKKFGVSEEEYHNYK